MAKPLVNRDFACPKYVQKKFKKKLTSPCCFGILIPHTVTTKQKYRKNMRTKTLIIAAAALAAGILASSAQTYSQNIVGYVNQTIQPGFSLIANPLNNDTNGANEILGALPDFSYVYVYSGGVFVVYESYQGAYYDPNTSALLTTPVLAPGTSFFINNAGSVFTNTYTGAVAINVSATGTNALIAGFQAVGSLLPEAGGVTSVLNLQPADFSFLYVYGAGTFTVGEYYQGAWYDPNTSLPIAEPQASTAQGFFINNNASAPWTQTMTP
jgi:hypothetical protein